MSRLSLTLAMSCTLPHAPPVPTYVCDMSVSKVAIFCHVKAKTAYITCCTELSWDISPHPHPHPHLSPNDIIFHPLTDCSAEEFFSPRLAAQVLPRSTSYPTLPSSGIFTQTCSYIANIYLGPQFSWIRIKKCDTLVWVSQANTAKINSQSSLTSDILIHICRLIKHKLDFYSKKLMQIWDTVCKFK